MGGVYRYEGFYAHCDHMPGSDRALRVGGTVVFRTAGWSACLRAHEPSGPTGTNPFILRVELEIDPPRGDVQAEVITPVELGELRLDDPALEYQEVHFTVSGSDDEAPEPIEVEHTQ